MQTPARAGLCPFWIAPVILLAGVAVLFLGREALWLFVGVGLAAVPASVHHDFALIALSSITGTVLIVEALQLSAIPVPSSAVIPAGMVLLVAGIVVQTMPFKQR